MLVYLREPMGYTELEGHRVYVRKYSYGSFGSTNIPVIIYKKYKDILEDAQYTQDWLEKKFNNKFPNISFDVNDLYKMNFKTMIDLAILMGVKCKSSAKKKASIIERHALRKSIIYFLNT